ncbi:MAG TPA: hypothetical protein VJ824_12970 [Bacillota bacterium]|nr:hypothetical protein [Bacillota bacterium]
MIQRRCDLAQRFINGEELKARDIVNDYGVSMKTAAKDMEALKAAGLLEDNPCAKTYRAKEKFIRRAQ